MAYLILCLLERGELDSAVVELDSSHLDGDLPDHLLCNSLLCARGKLRFEQGLLEQGIRDLLALDERERWQRNGESTLRFRSVSLPLALVRSARARRRRATRGCGTARAGGMSSGARH